MSLGTQSVVLGPTALESLGSLLDRWALKKKKKLCDKAICIGDWEKKSNRNQLKLNIEVREKIVLN